MRVEGESGRPTWDGNQVIGHNCKQSRDHCATVQTGTQRYEASPRDPSA